MPAVTGASGTASGDVDLIAVKWSMRAEPLAPHAVWAQGAAAKTLGKRILARQPESIEHLRCVSGDNFLLVLGKPEDLPWSDGVVYLGRVGACTMYMPTLLEPSVHPSLLERALVNTIGDLRAPFAVLPHESLVVPLADAQTIRAEFILRWLKDL